MSRKAKIGIISGVTLLLLLAGGWGYVYASSSNSPRQSPASDGHISNENPLISASLQTKTGVKVDQVDLKLDGSDIGTGIDLERYGFRYEPQNRLGQGTHRIVATIKYRVFLVPKTTTIFWAFEVDTIAPELSANDGHKIFATQKDRDVVTGHVDPGATISATYGSSAPKVEQELDGTFSVTLDGVGSKADLVVTATDLARNVTTSKMSVVKDSSGPKVARITPGNEEVVREEGFAVTADVGDKHSFVQSADVYVDGEPVISSVSKGVLSTQELHGLSEGDHSVKVIAVDGAGNQSVKNSKFTYDTRRIVVNRAERRLYLYRGGKLWRTWRVAIGQPRYPTPAGDWKIVAMRYRPTWVNPHQGWSADMPETIGPGAGNPLGTRAMNLDASGIRIHGTYQAGSIGSAASHGCIRMRLPDVEALFELVGLGVPVKII